MSRPRLLLLLFGLLVLAVIYAWQTTPRQQKLTNMVAVARDQNLPSGEQAAVSGSGQLNFSGGEKLAFSTPQRDLFRPLYRRPPVVKRQVVEPVKPAPPPPPPPKPRPQPVRRPVAGPEPIQPLQVLGFLRKEADLTVFLASRQGDLYLVKKGERFADDLLVRDLTEREVVISRGPDQPGVTLPLGVEQKSQRMSLPNVSSGRPSVPEYKPSVPIIRTPQGGIGKINNEPNEQ